MLVADISSENYTKSSIRFLSKYAVAADLMLRVIDLVIITTLGLVSHRVLYGGWRLNENYRLAIGTILLYSIICFAVYPLYRNWRGRRLSSELLVLAAALTTIFVLVTVHMVILQVRYSVQLSWVALWFTGSILTLAGARTSLRYVLNKLSRHGLDGQRIVIVGLRNPVVKLCHYLSLNPWIGLKVGGYFSTPYDVSVSEHSRKHLPCLGHDSALLSFIQANEVDQVWISLPLSESEHTKILLQQLDRYPVVVKLVPDLVDLGLLNQTAEQIAHFPIINLRQGGVYRDNYFVVVKSLQDKLFAGLALLVLWPVFLAIAVGVKLSSPGPVFFRQERHGLQGKKFYMLKFRSMYVHEASSVELRQATLGDRRVTRFGAFLRRTSLDELPQIINVLGGSMSIVGPRPHAAQHNSYYEKVIHRYMQRHYVKPGITGWAQVNGFRGETPDLRTMKKRIQYDLDYIRRWSLWLDMKIIVLTAIRVLRQKTAY